MATIHNPAAVSNWAGIHSVRPAAFLEPATVEEVCAIVKRAREEGRVVRVIGAGHSPSDCALSADVMVSLRKLNRVLMVDADNALVKVQGGIAISALNEVLDVHGLALPNLGSISHQSMAGAISTGTHGTGMGKGCMATSVVELQLVTGTGDVVVASNHVNQGQ
jgi:FAD/FMN-containing dehydrogenase